MATRKQRRRREKSLRHEYAFVTYDDEGNEIEVDRPQAQEEKKKSTASKAPASGRKLAQRRSLREPPPPSWRRSIRRGGLWGGVMLVVVVFLFRGMPIGARIAWGLVYAAAFIPLTYWVDRLAYRNYLRRSGKSKR